jgi:hypothetical protein
MELLAMISELRRHRLAVGLAALVALLVCVMVGFRVSSLFPPKLHSRRTYEGVATSKVLVNSPTSIVADLNPEGSGSLLTHAQLLGEIIASDTVRDAIAKHAGIPAYDLVVLPASIGGVVPTELATNVSLPVGAASIEVDSDPVLPVVSIKAQAATPAIAYALAAGAVTALQNYISDTALAEHIPSGHQPKIDSLGPPLAGVEGHGIKPTYAVVAGLILFLFLCYVIAVTIGIRRRMRETGLLEPLEQGPEPIGPRALVASTAVWTTQQVPATTGDGTRFQTVAEGVATVRYAVPGAGAGATVATASEEPPESAPSRKPARRRLGRNTKTASAALRALTAETGASQPTADRSARG